MAHDPYFHEASGSVRFWVQIGDTEVGASIRRETLHYRYRPEANGEDPLDTYKAYARHIDAAVRERVAQGSLEPVMLREHDLRNALP